MNSTHELDSRSMAALLDLTDAGSPDMNLAELVRSVAQPGLHARIAAYRQG